MRKNNDIIPASTLSRVEYKLLKKDSIYLQLICYPVEVEFYIFFGYKVMTKKIQQEEWIIMYHNTV